MYVGQVPDSIQNIRARPRVTINRPIYTEEDVGALTTANDDSNKEPLLSHKMSKWVTKKASHCTCSGLANRFLSFFPLLYWLPRYKRSYIVKDLVAGLTLGVFQIPQGMAYGMLTTLPPIYGLYTSLVPVLVYFFMGSSRFLSVGTFAIVSLMVGEAVESHFQDFPVVMSNPNATLEDTEALLTENKIKYTVTLSAMVGMFQVLFGLLRFGFITIFLSDALISGFTTGAAFHIATSQVKHLVGINIPRADTSGFFSLFKIYWYIFDNIKRANYVSFLIGLTAFILLMLIKHYTQKYKKEIRIPIPAELIIIVLGLGLSYAVNFHERYDVIILKNVPKGLPPISYPSFNADLIREILVDSLTIALVSYAISVSVAKAFAKKHGDKIDVNQELYAYGFANIISSFFSCFVSSASLSRSLLQENLGATQVASFYSILLVLLTLGVLAPIFNYLPNAILASIIMVALKGLFRQFRVVKVLLKISKVDAGIWISSFVAVICCGVDYGLAIGFILNLLATVVRASRPSSTLMGNIQDTEIYTTVGIEPANEMPGIKIFRFHAPLFYANTEYFQDELFKATVSPSECIKWSVPRCYQYHTEDLTSDKYKNGYVPPRDPDNNSKDEDIMSINEDEEGHGSIQKTHSKINITKITIPSHNSPFCPIHTIILDCSQISYADSMGASCLISVSNEYKKQGVDVLLAHCPASLLNTLSNGGFTALCGMDNIFLTTHDAVSHAYLKPHEEGICSPQQQDKEENSNWQMINVEVDADPSTVTDTQGINDSETTMNVGEQEIPSVQVI